MKITKPPETTDIRDFTGSQLLSGRKILESPNWRVMDTDEKMLHALLCAYAKHHLGADWVGWDQLSDILHNAICEAVGDDDFVRWTKTLTPVLD